MPVRSHLHALEGAHEGPNDGAHVPTLTPQQAMPKCSIRPTLIQSDTWISESAVLSFSQAHVPGTSYREAAGGEAHFRKVFTLPVLIILFADAHKQT